MTKTLFDHYTPADDFAAGTWIGRALVPGAGGGPAVVVVDGGELVDISRMAATTAALFELDDPIGFVRSAVRQGVRLGTVEAVLRNSDVAVRDPARPWLLSPVDCQAIKAAGVTFAASMVERVVEEQAKGDPAAADAIRRALADRIGADLGSIKPGSETASALKAALVERGLWSQYLEVGIGPDAEIFTKAQPLSSVGFGADIGVHPASTWNNPEPEIVLVVSSKGRIVGATLGNDVNLRDFEGRSALLLSKAKDNNASCAVGPFVRLFDSSFSLNDVRTMDITMTVEGEDGFVLDGHSSIGKISRDPEDLVSQTIGTVHQYPDGFALFLGTMFAPVKDRDTPGQGFTHKRNDVVTIRTAKLGKLINRMRTSDECEHWAFGIGAMMKNLASRGALK